MNTLGYSYIKNYIFYVVISSSIVYLGLSHVVEVSALERGGVSLAALLTAALLSIDMKLSLTTENEGINSYFSKMVAILFSASLSFFITLFLVGIIIHYS